MAPWTQHASVRIGFIRTSETEPPFRQKFGDMLEVFARLLNSEELELVGIDGYLGQLPAVDSLDGYLIPGALESADSATGWVRDLRRFVRQLAITRIPVVGVCFGQQIIAQALGGAVAPCANGWQVGVTDVRWQQTPTGCVTPPTGGQTRLYVCHSQEIVALPPDARCIASSDLSRIEAFVVGGSMLGVQGHPEFTCEVAEYYLAKNDIELSPSVVAESRRSLQNGTDHGEIGSMLAAFFSQRYRRGG